MAPSPTGELHIGHLRTFLYNYAWAKKNQGEFVVRIEDTDRERLVTGAIDKLLTVVADYGLNWDEGPLVGGPFHPYIQSERLPLYKKYAQELVTNGKAYYCFCTKERLDNLRKTQEANRQLPGYDRLCRTLSPQQVSSNLKSETPYVIRLKVPDDETITFTDVIMGHITFNSSAIDDQILLKSDGYPTYHLGVTVDDHLMNISYVIRGNEWISSTPKYILIYQAFGWELPTFAHLPVFLDPGGQGKMSKRHGATAARTFLENGYLPEAVLNYIMLLGWNPKTDRELFTLEEFISAFDLQDINKANPKFSYEKLNWFNQQYIRSLDDVTLTDRISRFTSKDTAKIQELLPLVKDRLVTLKDFDSLTSYIFETPTVDQVLFKPSKEHTTKVLEHAQNTLTANWDGKLLEEAAREYCAQNNLKVGDYFMILRIAVTGRTTTPPLWSIMEILGQEEILRRLKVISNFKL